MIKAAKLQNTFLREAAAHPKNTSHRLENAIRYSAKVSSSMSATRSAEAFDTAIVNNAGTSRIIGGSLEGLNNGKSALLQPNGVGYDDTGLQFARYADKSLAIGESGPSSNLLPTSKSYSIMDNYSSFTASGSSSSRIKSLVDANMML